MNESRQSSDGLVHDKERLKELQALPLERKISITQTRIMEWYQHWDNKVYVSFSGGKDSTILADLTARICKVMALPLTLVFVDTGLEYPEIRQFVKDYKIWLEEQYNIKVELQTLRPEMNFKKVIETYGYPVISKELAGVVESVRRNPNCREAQKFDSESEYCKRYGTRYDLSKYKYLLEAPFTMSKKCCDIMKKNPSKKFEKETGLKCILGTLASESAYRRTKWIQNGCNGFNLDRPTSQPISFWTTQDIIKYIKQYNIPYCSIYGDIVEEMTNYKRKKNKPTGKLLLTGEQMTGCMFCMFGILRDDEENRFHRMKVSHPKQYDYCIRSVDENGLGLGKVLDYIGVKY